MVDRVVAPAAGPVLEQLARALPSWSRNTLRQRLRLGCVEVNDHIVVRHDQVVQAGDVIVVHAKSQGEVAKHTGPSLPILHLDDDLLAIDKPTGLLSVSSDAEQQDTALAIARTMLRRSDAKAELWPAHRIDRETSGVLLFARSREVQQAVQANWTTAKKVYIAIVTGVPSPPDGTIEQPLWEDRNLRVRVGSNQDARPAVTHYRTIRTNQTCSQLEVELDTGRKHQIRAHLAWLGHPIVGDDRYGQRAHRLCLHAARLEVSHPTDGQALRIEAPMPSTLLQSL